MLIDNLIHILSTAKIGGDEQSGLLLDGLTHAVHFQVNNVAQYVHAHLLEHKLLPSGNYKSKKLLEEELPNVAPLAPVMWFEFDSSCVGSGDEWDQHGVFLSLDYWRDKWQAQKYEGRAVYAETYWILRAEWFTMKLHGGQYEAGNSDWLYYISISKTGTLLGVVERANDRMAQDGIKSPPDENVRRTWNEPIVIALTSICFAHCKGTVIEEHAPSRQVRRAAERSKKPIYSFHTIDIRPAETILRTEGNISENGLVRALHICRGHFAHYTDEKRLFGKYTGTFYHPMHLRGKAEAGISAKDYRVHPKDA